MALDFGKSREQAAEKSTVASKPLFNLAKKSATAGLKDKLNKKDKPKFQLGAAKELSNSAAAPNTEIADVPSRVDAISVEPAVLAGPPVPDAAGSLKHNAATQAIEDTVKRAIADDAATDKYTFDEQTDAFKPEDVEKMRAAFEVLRDSIDHPEIVSDAIANILKFLQGDEALAQLIEPEDYGVMVRALRMSYGTTITKKVNNKEKKVKSEKSVDEIVDALDGMQFEL